MLLRGVSSLTGSGEEALRRTRNIGIIAHIDAGKTTTTERMLYYSGFTRRLGNVDAGDTITDFLPAERARGITIQSAAITFLWPLLQDQDAALSESTDSPRETHLSSSMLPDKTQHTVNLIDTPGHADFTFEVIRSLRILDGAICVLDGVAGVEAQTEKVWKQAQDYKIPRLLYVNKLDRDGASFHRTVRDIASRLHTWPALCHIPWFKGGRFVGVGDIINFKGLLWDEGSDGRVFFIHDTPSLKANEPHMFAEMSAARNALIEVLTEHDDVIVEQVLEAGEDYETFSPEHIIASLRRMLVQDRQPITPVFAGASFRNIGIQPLLDSINSLLPSPLETADPNISLQGEEKTLSVVHSRSADSAVQPKKKAPAASSGRLEACALAFKVVNDAKRGVLVYIRVYSGLVTKNALLYNTNLAMSERVPRLLRMYASDAVEIDSIGEGQIGVIVGLKHARTGDTLIVYTGSTPKHPPPAPVSTLQLRPINVPPPLFYTSIEPNSLSEEKNLQQALSLLLREDPSLQVTTDPESGQTHLAGMGELHLEIARDRLLQDFKVKATMSKIEIGYRECLCAKSEAVTEVFARDVAGKLSEATSVVSVLPLDDLPEESASSTLLHLPDNNLLMISHAKVSGNTGKAVGEGAPSLDIPWHQIVSAIRNGVVAALSRGPLHFFPLHSAQIEVDFDPSECLTPTSTPAAITSATRQAVRRALEQSATLAPTVMLEPVMLATIGVDEASLGAVVHDLSSARGGSVLSLDAEEDAAEGSVASDASHEQRLSPSQLERVYAPKDPFESDRGGADSEAMNVNQSRQIRARVPLKEMVGYLKHLRSLTGGRGTFVMSVDQFERMSIQRQKAALSEIRGDFA